MNKQQFITGFLIIVLFSTGTVLLTLNNNVRLRIDNDKSTFYVHTDDNRWIISGQEYNKLYDGVHRLYRDVGNIKIVTNINKTTNHTIITRTTPYKKGPIIVDTYVFDGDISAVESFPISHTVNIINGTGYIYQYEIRHLSYDGNTTFNVSNPMSFGNKMNVEWTPTNYYQKVFKSGILKIKYRINSSNVSYSVRLFDPTDVRVDDSVYTAEYLATQEPNTVFISNLVGYIFYPDSDGPGKPVYRKTTDGGDTWSSPVTIDSNHEFSKISVWYDKWTSGDSGTLIHLAVSETSTDDTWYYSLNTTNDALSSGVEAILDSTTSKSDGPPAITKGEDGVLYITGPRASARQMSKSTDNGATWSDITPSSLFNDDNDYEQLFPISSHDIMLVYYDYTANAAYWWKYSSSTGWVSSSSQIYSKTILIRPNVGCTQDINTGNIYISNVPADDKFYIWKYTVSSGTWSIIANGVSTLYTDYQKWSTMAYVSSTNVLYFAYVNYDTSGDNYNCIAVLSTSDDGASWSSTNCINSVADSKPYAISSNFMSSTLIYIDWAFYYINDLYGSVVLEISPIDGTVTLGSGISKIQWIVPFNEGTTAYYVYPTGQTSSVGLFTAENTGSEANSLKIKMDDTYANVVTYCDDSNDYSSGVVLSTSWQTIVSSIDPSDTAQIWCYRNYTAIPAKKEVKIQFEFDET